MRIIKIKESELTTIREMEDKAIDSRKSCTGFIGVHPLATPLAVRAKQEGARYANIMRAEKRKGLRVKWTCLKTWAIVEPD